MIRPDIQIRGVSSHIVALNKMRDLDSIRIDLGLRQCGKLIFDESQVLVPKDTLALMKSGKVDVEGTGFFASLAVSYGGDTAPYAFMVHYDPTMYHTPPEQDHYLSDAIRVTKQQCMDVLNRTMRSGVFMGTRDDRSSGGQQVEVI